MKDSAPRQTIIIIPNYVFPTVNYYIYTVTTKILIKYKEESDKQIIRNGMPIKTEFLKHHPISD